MPNNDLEDRLGKLLAKAADEERRDKLEALLEEISRLMAVSDRTKSHPKPE